MSIHIRLGAAIAAALLCGAFMAQPAMAATVTHAKHAAVTTKKAAHKKWHHHAMAKHHAKAWHHAKAKHHKAKKKKEAKK